MASMCKLNFIMSRKGQESDRIIAELASAKSTIQALLDSIPSGPSDLQVFIVYQANPNTDSLFGSTKT